MRKGLSFFAKKGLRGLGTTSNLSLLSDLNSDIEDELINDVSDEHTTTNFAPENYLNKDGLHWHPSVKEQTDSLCIVSAAFTIGKS